MPYLETPDCKMYYEISGDGLPLLLVHGLGSSSRDWEKQVVPFSKSYEVIILDLRGHGRSDKPPGPYSIRSFANDVMELLTVLKVSPVHIVGISMGGMVAFELAVNFPDLLRSMVIVNSCPEVRVETLKEHLMIWRRYVLLELFGMRGTSVILGKHLFPNPDQSDLRELFKERWIQNDKRAYRASLRALVNWDVEDQIDKINCPVLVVASDKDYLPINEKKAYSAKMPNAKLIVIEDARHAVTAERPEQFNTVVMEFLSSISN